MSKEQITESSGFPTCWEMTLKGHPVHKKLMPRGPDGVHKWPDGSENVLEPIDKQTVGWII